MALITIHRSPSVQTPKKTDEEEKSTEASEDDAGNLTSKSLNECYFANKGAALVLGSAERGCADRRRSPARPLPQPHIHNHLQSMFYLVRPEETLKMAVKLESAHPGRTRYLVVVCRGDEAALLGIDCNERTTVGLVLRVLADTSIKLDGDGGFSVCVCNQQHIFKPVSVQAMWSALQTLHRASARARSLNHFAGGASHAWCAHYERRVDSDRSCLNEWHAMDCLESRRPPSPDSLRLKPREKDETERVIRSTLKEIMMSVDLDEVTSKAIRSRLEDELDMDLGELKSFIDQEMLTILGQMDAPTEIFDHVYLGSEWNASNLEELQRNGVRHILNVTREIDNFFPGMFDYLNIRVYDDEKTDLLKHWDNTFKYINKARNEGSKVLVHCKMGISRSASVVIAYAMKAFNWNFDKALRHVKAKRSCIKPNNNFLNQLETYQGILDAMKNKEKLQRSKSETNLKAPKSSSKSENKIMDPTPLVLALTGSYTGRPRSWSPDSKLAGELLPPTSVSLENLASETRHMLMPCAGGSYSVSPNQIMRLKEQGAPSVRVLVHEIERREPPRRARAPDRIHAWDPGEAPWPRGDSDDIVKSDSGMIDVKLKPCDASYDPVERRGDDEAPPPSRQSSWSSFDSAVVVDLSRHSSWGSGDARARPPPAPRDEPAPDLAVIRERAPPDLAANERKFNETCAILEELARMESARDRGASTWGGRLSASAPADTWLRVGPRRRRLAAASHGDLPRAAPAPRPPPAGLVSNLKKEFEARSATRARPPASPPAPPQPAEDLSVRVLVGRYDQPGRPREAGGEPSRAKAPHESVSKKCKLTAESEGRARSRTSYCGPPGERPPAAPTVVALAPLDYSSVVVSTVMSKAQNKNNCSMGKPIR
ncbi:LOW QUALITY PROTEIN: protein phosphatase Slingshot [Maniola jurtina]|uniref:LOW QUALITY PROTEIN: protein phosphatase Slingshot n=1 Tax=Maniola jurtina TaxID=191418 RepID=UPI001E68F075|nr:LOW QUALITY PROTEIN: protein phosphatase Slingshot [Maniola jurtina]